MNEQDMRAPISGSTPEEWLGRPDPVSAFSSSVEQALRALAVEVGGLRAERDGLRLELEGVRAQLEIAEERVARLPLADFGRSSRVEQPNRPETARRVPDWVRHVAAFMGVMVVLTVLAVSVGPKVLPYRTYFVRTGSMEPAISTDALVVLTKVGAEDLREGDVVTFDRPDRPGTTVTHRIEEVVVEDDGRYLLTKGDANAATDPWRIRAEDARWRVAFQVPIVGGLFAAFGSTTARVLLLAAPLVTLAWLWQRERRRGLAAKDLGG